MIAAFILAALQIADAVTTFLVLAKGGRELNPAIALLFERFGVKRVLVVKVIGVSAAGFWLDYNGHHAITALLIAGYVVVVANNLIVMRDPE